MPRLARRPSVPSSVMTSGPPSAVLRDTPPPQNQRKAETTEKSECFPKEVGFHETGGDGPRLQRRPSGSSGCLSGVPLLYLVTVVHVHPGGPHSTPASPLTPIQARAQGCPGGGTSEQTEGPPAPQPPLPSEATSPRLPPRTRALQSHLPGLKSCVCQLLAVGLQTVSLTPLCLTPGICKMGIYDVSSLKTLHNVRLTDISPTALIWAFLLSGVPKTPSQGLPLRRMF